MYNPIPRYTILGDEKSIMCCGFSNPFQCWDFVAENKMNKRHSKILTLTDLEKYPCVSSVPTYLRLPTYFVYVGSLLPF